VHYSVALVKVSVSFSSVGFTVFSVNLGFSSIDFGCFNDSFSHIYVNFLVVMMVIWAILPPRTIGSPYRSDLGHQ
jgi:hypothetical protein